MALSDTERDLIRQLELQLRENAAKDQANLNYYKGVQRVEQLGMAVPPEMRKFLVIANWCRTTVDTINKRQRLRSLILPGQETADADPTLLAIATANNLPARLKMFNRDRMIYGRAFMSVGTNAKAPELPLMRVESPRAVGALVDESEETMEAAGRFYRAKPGPARRASHLTLMTPDATIKAERDRYGRWDEVGDRDEHLFGRVPMVMHLNRRMSGEWVGESQMSDVIPLANSAARSLTNLQFAQEAHGIPRMWMAGVKKDDFIGADGKPIPMFEAYYDAIHMVTDPAGKVGQLTASDLKNFETALQIYGKQASTVTGFPARYFGLTTTNPPSADAIRADEAELVSSVEDQNEEVGMTLGWAAALAYEFSTGTEIEGNLVGVEFLDPATPTVAQREDALSKRRAQGVLSREGYWDELGWSEPRKAKEREYLRLEAENDPALAAARALTGATA